MSQHREQVRKDLIGLIAAMLLHENATSMRLGMLQAVGISVEMAKQMGLIPGSEALLEAVTVEKGRALAKEIEEIEPRVRAALEERGMICEDVVPAGENHTLHTFGLLADRIMEVCYGADDALEALIKETQT